MMKALTLWEPWASLVELGEKQFETRSWPTNYRGPLLIHAAASMPREAKDFCPEVAMLLNVVPYNGSRWYYIQHHCGPHHAFGHILAIADLVDCLKIVSRVKISGNQFFARLENEQEITGNELAFGDYTPGRFAWQLDNVHRLAEPIPAKGYQRIWNFNETPRLVAIDPWVIGATRIWTPEGVRSGKRVDPIREDAVMGLEVVA